MQLWISELLAIGDSLSSDTNFHRRNSPRALFCFVHHSFYIIRAYVLYISQESFLEYSFVGEGIFVLVWFYYGIVDQETTLHHIDFNTLGLLIGMMIIVTITADTGLFKIRRSMGSQEIKR
jgi:hypothetical protein